jgi:hypothetical protein
MDCDEQCEKEDGDSMLSPWDVFSSDWLRYRVLHGLTTDQFLSCYYGRILPVISLFFWALFFLL